MTEHSYNSPRWLPGGHLQTIFPAVARRPEPLRYRRERWDTPDGDFIDLDWVDGSPHAPLVVLFHGLEGSSASHYALALMRHAHRLGWRGVVPHFRGCSGELNRLPRAYHAGDSAEVDWILRRLRAQSGDVPIFAAGVSLGGNMLLKWSGEQASHAQSIVSAVAGISVPLDLAVAGIALDAGLSRHIYTRNFLQTLRHKALQKLACFPHLADRKRILMARTFSQFDDAFTAPIHGFRDKDDYWQQASSKPWLKQVKVPALVLNARNDPFLPAHALPARHEVASVVQTEYPEHGGHVGFLSGEFPGHLDWLPHRLELHFRRFL
ncbi:hydrolase [Chitinivorax sp. B]|uniref:hydrolase n=1 Tax=Chitinivorax sp. B TaxID=2502235 RepID=UPI0010FA2E30|nr:hydrolase [Chitinivorax sp. B]